jgi:hypothetical protein
MAILKRKQPTTIEIDLTGPQGNAFFLLGTAQRLSKQLGFDTQKVLSEMQSGDYENLIQVFDSYFGSVVTLYR